MVPPPCRRRQPRSVAESRAMLAAMARVLLTGADGYIGVRLGDHLLRAGFDVVGLDSGFHRVGWLYPSADLRPAMLTKDIRELELRGSRGIRRGGPPRRGLQRPRRRARRARHLPHQPRGHGPPRRACQGRPGSSASCRCPRAACTASRAIGRAPRPTRSNPSLPTRGARCWSRRPSASSPTTRSRRCSSATPPSYGASPRQRFDLVVNDLAATAYLYKEIRMTSDGTPWRPFVHLLDVAAAVSCVLDAPREVVHGEIFNVGSSASNYQIRQIAQIVGELVPGCVVSPRRLECGQAQLPDRLHQDRDDLAGLRLPVGRRARRRRAARRLRAHRARRTDVPVARLHPSRPDPPPARHGADHDDLFWTTTA